MDVIELRNATKCFNEFVAVRDLSFTVPQGSIFGLLGPNGAGKTTSIRMIVNITAPDEGEVLVMGQHMNSKLQERIGYLPEERGLYKKMTIGDQLLFFGEIKGLDQRTASVRTDEWLAKFELTEWKSKKPPDLSKGMQQKVQFIATVLHNPDVLILDEPFSGLDPVSVSVLKEAILDLKRQGKTVIFSTHQMEQVEQMCDDICLINHATKVLGGRLKEVKRRFGRNTVILDYEGTDEFLTADVVKRHTRNASYSEILLQDGANAQEILRRALDAGAIIRRFELVEPSLNEIFIESVTGTKQLASQRVEVGA